VGISRFHGIRIRQRAVVDEWSFVLSRVVIGWVSHGNTARCNLSPFVIVVIVVVLSFPS
jgi:hypothetical protein